MKHAIETMKNAISEILDENLFALYLYGSIALNDFRLGWSDIDLLCLTRHPLSEKEAENLLSLRQRLLENDPENPYFRSFEGAFLSLDEFQSKCGTRIVYWGTSGERITDHYALDAFSMAEIIQSGILLDGADIRENLRMPTYEELRCAVITHYETIRKYAVKTSASLYSCGWLLDIARGIYTLRTGTVIAKTAAGKWALREKLCPVENDLVRTLEIRQAPLAWKEREDTKSWLTALGPSVQAFADVLEDEIKKASVR